MKRRKESKTRSVDREIRQSGSWTRIGFAIILIGAVIALVLVLLG